MATRRNLLIMLAAATLSTMTLGAAAQDAGAPHPSPDVQTLYAHGDESDEYNQFMNTLVDDGSDIALGDGSEMVDETVTWTLTLNPPLAGTVTLDAEGAIEVSAYLGGSTAVGQVSLTTQILSGETVVATGEAQDHAVTPADAESDGNYQLATWSLTPEATTLAAGTDLVWTITADGSASALFLGVGESRGRSNIVLPILAVDAPATTAGPIQENLTGPAAEVDLAFNETTSATYLYNWTANDMPYDLSADSALENGSVSFAVVDAEDSEVVNGAVNATNASASDTIHGAAGNWSIRVDADNATGTFTLRIASAPISIIDAPDDTGNETGNQTEDAGLPGPGAVAVSAALALAALAAGARRKRV